MLGRHPADQPVEEDQLGISPHVEGLAEFIRRCETPFTVAIQGDWGTGKTTMLKLLRHELSRADHGEAPVSLVEFDVWQAAFAVGDEATFTSLVATIAAHVQKSAPQDRLSAVSSAASRVVKAVIRQVNKSSTITKAGATAANVLLPGSGFVISELVPGIVQDLTTSDLPGESNTATVRDSFHALMETRFTDPGRLVVLVDNLDRLRPERAVEIMECLKALLDSPHCVFIVAIDFDVVVQGLKDKYSDMSPEKARAFFDKIIQLPFLVPVNSYKLDELLAGLFQPDLADRGGDDLKRISNVVAASVGQNPRAIKRLYNSYSLIRLINKDHQELPANFGLLSQIALQIAFPDVHRYLDDDTDLEVIIETLSEVADSDESDRRTVAHRAADSWTPSTPGTGTAAGGDLTTSTPRRGIKDQTDRLAQLLVVMAEAFTDKDGIDEDHFRSMWRSAALTSNEGAASTGSTAPLTNEQIHNALLALDAGKRISEVFVNSLDAWEKQLAAHDSDLRKRMSGDTVRISHNKPGRGRPSHVGTFTFPRMRRDTVTVRINVRSLPGDADSQAKYFDSIAGDKECSWRRSAPDKFHDFGQVTVRDLPILIHTVSELMTRDVGA